MPSNLATLAGYKAVIGGLQSLKEQFTDESTWVVGSNVEYAVYVEVGTSKMAAQPYLRPAVQEVMGSAGSIIESADSLDAALGQLAHEVEAEAKRRAPVDTGTLRASISAQKVG